MPSPSALTASLRSRLATALRDRVAGPDAERRAHAIWLAPGERRFAPTDPVCRVQGHAAMYAGGMRALLLQALHPLAMAGVGEHSGYRDDPWGRLQRTSEFLAMTTFGPVEAAERMIDRINRLHETVSGTTRDGRPYAATDPHLLEWVHIAEIDSFLVAHQRYSRTPLTPAEADTYVDQAAYVATRLGVPEPPRTVAELERALASYRPELETSRGALDVVRFLLAEPPLPWAARPGFWMLAAGAVELLPGYAREMLGLRPPRPLRGVEAVALRSVAGPLGVAGTRAVEWALGDPTELRNAPDSSFVTG
ncbi:oxygenase MpaB family protein [Ornithinimicrobium pekingense]|uniref:oxygenase MpaB family protein n=1 Tax=Ornithinimicrobium pekingense TaxID=384677 RepID=UPI0003B54814|nr:oxygenase MpaB family protein [Ornithinimicrobium pekingense]